MHLDLILKTCDLILTSRIKLPNKLNLNLGAPKVSRSCNGNQGDRLRVCVSSRERDLILKTAPKISYRPAAPRRDVSCLGLSLYKPRPHVPLRGRYASALEGTLAYRAERYKIVSSGTRLSFDS